MTQTKILLLVLFSFLALSACAKKETKLSAESSVVSAGKDVVEATGDVLRGAVEGVNDAVYGKKK